MIKVRGGTVDADRAVIYRPEGGEPEEGVIVRANKDIVFVRYGEDATPKGTLADDLFWADGEQNGPADLTLDEVAERLAVSYSTARKIVVVDRRIPFHRITNRQHFGKQEVRVLERDLTAFVDGLVEEGKKLMNAKAIGGAALRGELVSPSDAVELLAAMRTSMDKQILSINAQLCVLAERQQRHLDLGAKTAILLEAVAEAVEKLLEKLAPDLLDVEDA